MAAQRLGAVLKRLRTTHWDFVASQQAIATALGVSRPLVGAWERDEKGVSDEYLDALARLFAVNQSEEGLVVPLAVSGDDRAAYQRLLAEFEAARAVPGRAASSFWAFDDGLPITIITSRHPPQVLANVPEADPVHPDHCDTLRHADADAEIELYAHLKRVNPDVEVRRRLAAEPEDPASADDLMDGHVVVLGGGSVNPHAELYSEIAALPLAVMEDSVTDAAFAKEWRSRRLLVAPEYMEQNPKAEREERDGASWVVVRPTFGGTFPGRTRTGSETRAPNLETDVAVIARRPSDRLEGATVTLCFGLFARGTTAAALAFVDDRCRESNEAHLSALRSGSSSGFWIVQRLNCDARQDNPNLFKIEPAKRWGATVRPVPLDLTITRNRIAARFD